MAEPAMIEGREGVNRIEAFSDGVLAIIITIMVLELVAPKASGLAALWELWPTFLAYVLSYFFIAIYWVNHHRLFGHARKVTNGLVWSNIALLFTLSLIPFTTAYFGEHFLDPAATTLYLASMLPPALAYRWLQSAIKRSGSTSALAMRYHTATMRKAAFGSCAYLFAALLAWWFPAIAVTIAAFFTLL